MTATLDAIVDVPGVPETTLTSEILERALAVEAPPAPWKADVQALCWLARGSRAALDALSPGLKSGGRPLMVAGGLLRFLDTPVGPYDEVITFAVQLGRRGPVANVPFIAVNSIESLVGGRVNWSLPKTLAEFNGGPTGDWPMTARGDSWQVTASAQPFGPSAPFRGRVKVAQEWPDGVVRQTRVGMRGRFRLARVTIKTSGGTCLTDWLRSGKFAGFIVEHATCSIPPTPR
jgi:hypothetical protein